MSIDPATARDRGRVGRIGGLRRAALAPDRQAITEAARDARWQKYLNEGYAALPDLTDPNEITMRAELFRRADKLGELGVQLARIEEQLKGVASAGTDHESRIRALERWSYSLPVSLAISIALAAWKAIGR